MHAFQFLVAHSPRAHLHLVYQQNLRNSPSVFTPTCFTSTDKIHRPNLLHLAVHTAQQPLQLNMCPPLCISIAKTFRSTGAHDLVAQTFGGVNHMLGLKDTEYYPNFQIPPEKRKSTPGSPVPVPPCKGSVTTG